MAQRKLWERALGTAARELDLLVTGRRISLPGGKTRAERLSPDERSEGLARISEFYGPYAEDPDRLFPPAATIAPTERPVGSYGRDGSVVDLTWQTDTVSSSGSINFPQSVVTPVACWHSSGVDDSLVTENLPGL